MAVVVAQLAKQSLPIPEVRDSNPVIGKILKRTYLLLQSVNAKIKTKLPVKKCPF